MINPKCQLLAVIIMVFSSVTIYSQTQIKNDDDLNAKLYKKLKFFSLRGTSGIDLGAGSTIANGDLPDPEFELYFKVGYRYHISSHLNFNLSYNKYNLSLIHI